MITRDYASLVIGKKMDMISFIYLVLVIKNIMPSWTHITIDEADKTFSIFVRLKFGKCQRCGKRGSLDKEKRAIKGLQASHFFGRRKESVRYDEENVDCLCAGCHKFFDGGDRNIDYREFKIQQLGQEGYDMLCVRAETFKKKDRKMSLIIAKELLKGLLEKLNETDYERRNTK